MNSYIAGLIADIDWCRFRFFAMEVPHVWYCVECDDVSAELFSSPGAPLKIFLADGMLGHCSSIISFSYSCTMTLGLRRGLLSFLCAFAGLLAGVLEAVFGFVHVMMGGSWRCRMATHVLNVSSGMAYGG
ncbi:hypothetical protein Nepgr_033625 [Nepenthes gracilis]|uniref:Uncharacterized protein n=1 Tax=Nepenthes gracilis TaxID=150966 RepID=A0AAD3TM90_NEPGR|nr:hypothetical protein Nepgr_033625 [Nepenthes gracilis]